MLPLKIKGRILNIIQLKNALAFNVIEGPGRYRIMQPAVVRDGKISRHLPAREIEINGYGAFLAGDKKKYLDANANVTDKSNAAKPLKQHEDYFARYVRKIDPPKFDMCFLPNSAEFIYSFLPAVGRRRHYFR